MSFSRQRRRRVLSIVVGTLIGTGCLVVQAASPATAAIESPLTLGYDQQIYGDFLQAGNAVGGGTAPGRFNSSSASVTIPAGAAVDYAQLLWAGNTGVYKGSTTLKCGSDPAPATAPAGSPATTPVKLTVGGNAAVSVRANRLTIDTLATITGAQYYSAAADVTSALGTAPTGSALTVNVANVWTPRGDKCFGGWSIIVVYKYPTANANAPDKREVFLYDGHVRQASTDPATSTTITGFTANGQAKVGVVAYQADWGTARDRFRINNTAQTDRDSPGRTSHDNTDTFAVPTTVIRKGDTSASFTFSSTRDSYLAELLALSVPVPVPAKTVGHRTVQRVGTPSVGTGGASPSGLTAAPQPGLGLVEQATVDDVDGDGLTDLDDTITWTFTLTNLDTVTLTEATVTDPAAGPVSCQLTTLAAGDSTRCTAAAHPVSQSDVDQGVVTNTATATGRRPGGARVRSDEASASTPVDQTTGISLVKAADPTSVSAAGDAVDYTFTVTNTGTTTLSDVSIDDTLSAPAAPALAVTCPSAPVAPGTSTDCTATYTATQDDLDHGTIDNTATASATGPAGGPVISDPSDATVTALAAPGLTLVKSASPTTVSAVGDPVTYTFDVANTGNVTVTDLSVDDALAAPAGPALAPIACAATSLRPGTGTSCTAVYSVTQDDLDHGSIGNTATVTGTDPNGNAVRSDPSTATVDVDQNPDLSVVKSATPTTVHTIGQQVSYTFRVTNTGNVTLTGISVTDTLSVPAGPQLTPVCPGTTLAPGASTDCTATYTSTAADFDNGTIDNSAVATGTPPAGGPVTSDPSTASVTTTQIAALALVQKATVTDLNGNGYADLDDTIQWTFAVTNTGTVTLTDIGIDDAQAGAATCPAGALAPADAVTCDADTAHVITQADVDAGHVDNTATADGASPHTGGNAVTSDPSSTTTPIGAQPGLGLVTTGAVVDTNDDDLVGAGDTVVWKFAVTNTGNVTMSTITVNDPSAGHVSCTATSLAPNLSTTCQAAAPRRLTVADVDRGSVTNTATATGAPPSGPPVESPPSTATVPLPADPALTIVETASVTDADDNGFNDAGDHVAWSFVVTNAGNVTLTAVRVADPEVGTVSCPLSALAPAARMTCTSTSHTIAVAEAASGLVTNTATATGRTPSGNPVRSPPSTATVTINAPAGADGANGGIVGGNSGGNVAYTGAKDLPVLVGIGGWSLLAGLLLIVLGTLRRRRRA